MQNDTIQKLTKAEEQIMQIIWKLNGGFLKEIHDAFPEPKPHSNTIATIVKILVDKNFIKVKIYGRNHMYIPQVSKDQYSKLSLGQLVEGYFEGNFSNAVSFMIEKKDISIKDLELLLKQIKAK